MPTDFKMRLMILLALAALAPAQSPLTAPVFFKAMAWANTVHVIDVDDTAIAQNPAPPADTFVTQWVSAGNMGHIVTTHIGNNTPAGITEAGERHRVKVRVLATLFPPVPIPGSGGNN